MGIRKWRRVVIALQAMTASASAAAAVEAESPEPSIPPDAPRPRFELSARTGWNIPTVESGGDVSAGPGVGGLFLFRPASGVAFGVSGDVARFPWQEDQALLTISYGADLRFYAAMPRNWELYANALFALVDVTASAGSAGCDADHGMVLGTTLGAERYFTTSLRLGAELGYHFGGTYPGICPSVRTSNGPASIPEFSPGFALRVVGTYGTR